MTYLNLELGRARLAEARKNLVFDLDSGSREVLARSTKSKRSIKKHDATCASTHLQLVKVFRNIELSLLKRK